MIVDERLEVGLERQLGVGRPELGPAATGRGSDGARRAACCRIGIVQSHDLDLVREQLERLDPAGDVVVVEPDDAKPTPPAGR